MQRLAILCLIGASNFLLTSCASVTGDAKASVTNSLPYRRDVTFDGVKTFSDGTVCGEYTAFGADGYRRHTRPFIVTGALTLNRPTDEEIAIFCTEKPGAALQALQGIGPVARNNTALVKIRDDLTALQGAIAAFEKATGNLPRRMGLAALVPPHGEYLTALPQDPWGQPYQFEAQRLGGRVKRSYALYTLGADNTRGGKLENADIDVSQLRYLDRALALGR